MSDANRRLRATRAFTIPSIFELEPIERRVFLTGTISGSVFSDYDSDGAQDANEPGLAGWTVYIDANDNNIPEAAELKRTTDANGAYSFANLAAPATYNVREVLQAGYQQTIPGTGGVILGGAGDAGEGEGTGDDGNANRPFSKTEIVVAFRGTRGRSALVQAVNNNANLRRLVNLGASSDMFTVPSQQVTLVEVKLPAGVDPQLVVQRFAALNNVAWAQPNYIYEGDPRDFTPNDPQYGSQYHHPLMRNNGAWDTTMGRETVTMAITDDGFDTEHVDLYQNIWINQNEIPASRRENLTDLNGDGYISMTELQDPTNRGPFKAVDTNADNRITAADLLVPMVKDGTGADTGAGGWTDLVDQGANTFVDDVVGRDFWNNDNDSRPAAGNSHGTHVIGIAAAETNNGVGLSGTAGGISVMPLRFYSTSGGTWTSTIISNSYRYAASNGAKILSTSYNVDQFSTGPDAIFAAGVQFMYDNGVLHFNSQGNNATLLNPPRQRWDQSLFVVSTNQNDIRSSFSKYGWGADVSAPGENILSTLPSNSYGLNSGTSMSTPNAAGVAALVWSAHPTWTREQVASAVTGTADPIDAINPSFAGLLGTGRVNSLKAVTQLPRAPQIKNMGLTFPVEGAQITTITQPLSFTMDVNNIFDPATVNNSAFEIRGAGVDGEFNTSDDRLLPFTLRFGSALTTNYMIGTNRLNFTVPAGSFTPDKYRFATTSTLRDPFGQSVDGNNDGTGGDAFARSFTLLAATNRYTVNLADGQTVANANFGNHDVVGPRSLASLLEFNTSPHKVTVRFNEDVSDSLAIGDLTLENLTTGLPVNMSGFAYSYDTATNTATWNANSVLPDARFRGTILATNVSDRSGNAMDGDGNGVSGDDHNFNFFFQMADANHDGRVNLDDFNVLATNFGQTGTNFSRGDFNYDGQTNLADFDILAGRFGNVLAGASTSGSSSSSQFDNGDDDEKDSLSDLLG